MVQVLPTVKSFGAEFGSRIGTGLGEGFSKGRQLAQEDAAIKKHLGLDLSGVTDPNTRQALIADQLKFGRKMKQAEASQGVSLLPKEESQRTSRQDREDFLSENRLQERRQLPGFAGEKKESRSVEPFAHGAQPETQGGKYPISNPQQIIQDGIRLAQERTQSGLPTTAEEGIQLAHQMNQLKEDYNSKVDQDIERQKASQAEYGARGQEKLLNVLPKATDEQQALFQRYGEELSRENKSESEINRELSRKAVAFKNSLANIEKSLPAPRLLEKIKRNVLGTNRDWEKQKQDVRIKLSPLLNEGLYDTARNVLSEIGYSPEEREEFIADLGENAKKILTNFPKIKKSDVGVKRGYQGMLMGDEYYTPEDREKIKTGISEVINSDPSINLILLRKAFEEKGVDWDVFKDDLNDLILSGQIKLNDDQFKHLDLLDSPPLNNLDKILHSFKLIGR